MNTKPNLLALVRTVAMMVVFVMLVACGGMGNSVVSKLFGSPTITTVSPNPIAPGSEITITGTNFNGTSTTVNFRLGSSTTQTNATAGNYTSITATVPSSLSPGTYSIDVVSTNSSGIGSAPSNAISLTVN